MIGTSANIPQFANLTSGDEVIVSTPIPDFYVQLARGDKDEPDDDFYYVYAKHEITGWEWELVGTRDQLLAELEPDSDCEDTRCHDETLRVVRVALGMSDDTLPEPEPETPGKIARYGGDDCMRAIEAAGWGKGFAAGNVLKYVWRYERKGGVDDLKKAQWYLQRLIEMEERDATES